MGPTDRIAELRSRKGWTQGQLAALIGTSQQHISLIERGACGLEVETLSKILSALGYELSLRQTAEGPREALKLRRAGWEKLARFEKSHETLLPPADRLARIAECVQVYCGLHAPKPPTQKDLRAQALDIVRCRRRLALIGILP